MSEVFCNKCGFFGQADERGNHNRPNGSLCPYVGLTRPQPTASVDAEPVADQVAREVCKQIKADIDCRGRGLFEATNLIQAYGDARADAARREALGQLNAALEIIDEAYRKYGVEFDAEDISAAQRCRDFWLAAREENPNAG